MYLFFSTKKEEVDKIKSQGGMFLKYKILIDHFLSYPGVIIESKSSYSIVLALKDNHVITRFTISHGFEDVSVFWDHQSISFGKHSLSWKFSESLPQTQMIDIIENELEIYTNNLLKT